MSRTVTIDARWLVGGIGTYTKHLLAGVAPAASGFCLKVITRSQHVEEVHQWCGEVKVVDAPIYSLREQWMVVRAASGSALLHVPHYNAPLFHRGPLLVSIHDVIHICDPSYRSSLKSRVYASPMLQLVTRKAEHIVTVSEYTKKQIVERLGVPPEKVTVIYNGVNGEFQPVRHDDARGTISRLGGFEGPYILYVGSLKPYKNVSGLLRAFAVFHGRHAPPHKLLIVGDDAKCKEPLLEECSRLGIQNAVRFVPQVPQAVLPKVYVASDALVMPSRIEGFGLPVLEAMASGTPVICSRAASLPEVAGDAAVYFDPKNDEELADVMERVLSSRELQESLRAKGLERAKRFTWEESIRKHVELYRRLLAVN